MRGARIILTVIGTCAVLLIAALIRIPGPRAAAPRPRAASAPRASIDVEPRPLPEAVEAVIVGGGAEPESSGVQLEQDVALARALLGERSYVLFGAGAGPTSVRTLGPDSPSTSRAHRLLAEIFDPRERNATYRATTLAPDAPATKAHVLHVLDALVSGPRTRAPLTLFVAAHGMHAPDPSDAVVDLWSGDELSVRDLAELYASATRPIVTVITSCYGGAFAETALDVRGSTVSCGLFATTHDRVASGCDANPERSVQEGFALHFFAALRREDRSGGALPMDALDLDRDGRISYLEAHARARVASRGFDVPTTTSERWLRARTIELEGDEEADGSVDALEPAADPIEDAVIARLARELDVATLPIARAMLARLGAELDELEAESLDAEEARDAAYRRLRILLLERWPHLDDPWHPEHHATIEREGEAIARLLTARAELRALREQNARLDALAEAFDRKLVEESRVLRLVRAMENVRMLAALRAEGGDALARYEALRACERGP